ncbi:MAG: hypothetical protein IJJ43_03060, partial [Oscillospiraceae bacterium]|nr:hypothetical protein [Oscillospiraceae bacterium]
AGDIDAISFSLYADSETRVYLYLNMKEGYAGTPTATLGGESLTVSPTGVTGEYRIILPALKANGLGNMLTVTVSDGTASTTVKVSALSYVRSVLDPGKTKTEAVKNFASALYQYNREAVAISGQGQ